MFGGANVNPMMMSFSTSAWSAFASGIPFVIKLKKLENEELIFCKVPTKSEDQLIDVTP